MRLKVAPRHAAIFICTAFLLCGCRLVNKNKSNESAGASSSNGNNSASKDKKLLTDSLVHGGLVMGACAVRKDTMQCVGRPPAYLGKDVLAVEVVGSNRFNYCARTKQGKVKCWGVNHLGQLGIGDTLHRVDNPSLMGDALPYVDLGTHKKAVALAAGHSSFCAILNDGSVKCWGDFSNSLLYTGDIALHPGYVGDSLSEMGDNLPTIDLGPGRTAKAISAGTHYYCAILDDDSTYCWSYVCKPTLATNDYSNPNIIICGPDPHKGPTTVTGIIDFGTNRKAIQLSLGNGGACALLDNGSVKCWGNNSFGSAGYGANIGFHAHQLGDNLPAVDLGTGRTAVKINSHLSSVCAILDTGDLKCWGNNSNGQLGYGDLTNRGLGPNQMGDFLPTLKLGTGRTAIDVSGSCALLDDYSVKCWGGYGSGPTTVNFWD